MNIICIRIRSGKKIICYTPNSPDIVKKTKQGGVFHQIFNLINSMESYKKGFDIISTIFRLVGSRNLGFDNFQKFEHIRIFEFIHEYFL